MSNELAPIDPPQSASIALIRDALANNVDPASLRELLAVKRDWEADEARKLYSQAIADFQSRCPIIEKADKAHNKAYAALDRIWRTIRKLLEETGLSIVWTINQLTEHGLHIEGEIRHRAGHSVPISYDLPMPDKITGQNAAQQMGSATSYAKRYALCAALGIVTGADDDGGSAGGMLNDEQMREVRTQLAEAERLDPGMTPRFLKWIKADSVETIPLESYNLALNELNRKIKAAYK